MNSGSFGDAASIAMRLIIKWPFSPQAAADTGTTRSRKHRASKRIRADFNRISPRYNQSMVIAIADARIEAVRGDISQAEVDAVVNAANNHLWMGAGVAGALKRAGGIEIEREAVSKGPIEIGEAAVTTGGGLRARYVIHAAVMGQDLQTDRSKISTATRNALIRARE